MKHYYIFPNACCEFDDKTDFHNIGTSAMRADNIGLVFDGWPLDDFFTCHPELFCSERLKFLLERDRRSFTGISFAPIKRITTGSNWDNNFPSANPGNYWQVNVTGRAFEHDFGLWSEKRYLIASGRSLEFLLQNHVSEILGNELVGDASNFFEEYEQGLKESRYTLLPPKIFDMQAHLKQLGLSGSF